MNDFSMDHMPDMGLKELIYIIEMVRNGSISILEGLRGSLTRVYTD